MIIHRSRYAKFRVYNCEYFLICVVGAQKNRLIETVLLSSHNTYVLDEK